MRKSCLVLVSLFIVLGYGFIIPAGISKVPSFSTSEVSTADAVDTKNNLENYDRINQSELYKNVINKTSNLTARSFIYLQQKLRPRYRNHLFKQLLPGLIQPLKTFNTVMADKMPILFMKARQDFLEPEILPHIFIANLNNNQRSQKFRGDFSRKEPKLSVNRERVTPAPVAVDSNNVLDFNVKKPIRYYFSGSNPRIAQMAETYNNNIRSTSYTQRLPYNHNQSCGYLKTNQLYRIRTYSNRKNESQYKPIHIYPDIGPFTNDEDKYERYIKEILKPNDVRESESKDEDIDDCDGTKNGEDGENHIFKKSVFESPDLEDAVNTLTSLNSED